MKRRRTYMRDFKISVIREVESGKTLAQVSRENEIHPSLVVKWKKEYFRDPENAFRGNGRAYKEQARMAELERLVGQLYAENEFLKKALTRLEGKIKEGWNLDRSLHTELALKDVYNKKRLHSAIGYRSRGSLRIRAFW